MNRKNKETDKEDRIEKIFTDEKQITETLQRAVRDAVRAHKRHGNSIGVFRNGKTILIKPQKT